MILKKKIVEVLKNCFDPEIPIDLWNLGLIYDIELSGDNTEKVDVHIIMSLTTPGCSMGSSMAEDIKKQLSRAVREHCIKEITHFGESPKEKKFFISILEQLLKTQKIQ